MGKGRTRFSEAVALASHHSLRVSPVGKWAPGGQRAQAQLVPSPQLRRRVPQSRAWLRRVTAASPEAFLRKPPITCPVKIFSGSGALLPPSWGPAPWDPSQALPLRKWALTGLRRAHN